MTNEQSGYIGLIAAVVFFVLALAGGAWVFLRDTGIGTFTVTEPASAPAEVSRPETTVDEAAAPVPEAPRFDEIRREADGTTVIAGRAKPGSTVSVRVDGNEVGSAEVDAGGGFAIVSNVPGSDAAQVMTLIAQADGVDVTSDEEIILAPVAPAPLAPPSEPQVAQIAQQADGGARATSTETSEQSGTTSTDMDPLMGTTQDAVAISAPSAPQPEMPGAMPATASDSVTKPSPPAVPSEPAQVAILKSDAQGVTLLQPSSPRVTTNVAIDTIGYSDGGEVQLSGRAQGQATEVRVYLDNKSVVTLPVDAQGRWRGDLPDVDEGVYTLRVDEVKADGTVSSRVETPFQRESAEVLAEAASVAAGKISAITVQKGATLWAIARDRYGDGLLYVKVFEANNDAIRDPDLIYPGQVFSLPD